MENNFDELVENMKLAYNTGEKVRISNCIRLAKELLLTPTGALDITKCRDMIKNTSLRLGWRKQEDIENKEYLAVRYKDIAIEFYSSDITPSPKE
jgi:hypothetical protein